MGGHDSCPMLYLVLGGELSALSGTAFRSAADVHVVGVFDSYAEAEARWRGAAQASVDAAMTRYFIVPIAHLLDPAPPSGKSAA